MWAGCPHPAFLLKLWGRLYACHGGHKARPTTLELTPDQQISSQLQRERFAEKGFSLHLRSG
jgi:hypothetical protein